MTNAETKRFPGQSVSRILSSVGLRFTLLLASSLKIRAWAVIYLGCRSLGSSCSQPETRVQRAAARLCLALLLAGVTRPRALLPVPVVSYTTISPLPTPALFAASCNQSQR